MLSLKLVRSLVLGDSINITNNSFLSNSTASSSSAAPTDDVGGHGNDNDGDLHDHAHQSSRRKSKSKIKTKAKTTPLLIFLPTHEVVKDTYRLCTIARDMGMNLHPNPSLSHIIFSWPSPPQPQPSSSSTSIPSLWSSTSTSTWSLSNDFVPLPFPSLTHASTTHLQCFVNLSKGLFKLVFCKFKKPNNVSEPINNWDCSSLSLFSRVSGDRIDSMDCFTRVLAGMGWTMYKTKNNPLLVSGNCGSAQPVSVYLFRKIESSRVEISRANANLGKFRVRELRLPTLDFRNAPLRILQYILLMTDNIFYLA